MAAGRAQGTEGEGGTARETQENGLREKSDLKIDLRWRAVGAVIDSSAYGLYAVLVVSETLLLCRSNRDS